MFFPPIACEAKMIHFEHIAFVKVVSICGVLAVGYKVLDSFWSGIWGDGLPKIQGCKQDLFLNAICTNVTFK